MTTKEALVTTQEALVAQENKTTKAKQEAKFWKEAFNAEELKKKSFGR